MKSLCARFAAIFFALPAFLISPVLAADYQSPAVGGPGGAPFTLRCADGDYLVGLRVRSGSIIDAVAPLCARWEGGETPFLEPGIGPLHGGGGGSLADFRCDRASVITGIYAEAAPNQWDSVAIMVPRCGAAAEPTRRTQASGPRQFGLGISDRASANDTEEVATSAVPYIEAGSLPECRRGDVAVGIYGGAGTYVDRIGLICAPAPRVIIFMPMPAQPRPMNPADANRPAPDVLQSGAITPADANRPQPSALQPPRCRSGFVWREASDSDFVCVTPESRARASQENAVASSRVNPDGPYGANTCLAGFVWREAFEGDVVCVTPEIREQVRQENATAASRTM